LNQNFWEGFATSNLCFNKPSKWFWYMCKFENHCIWRIEAHIERNLSTWMSEQTGHVNVKLRKKFLAGDD
jgi:hypothetical protein